jgi:hypothetical protein
VIKAYESIKPVVLQVIRVYCSISSSGIAFEDFKVNVGWGLRLDMSSIFGDKLLRFDLAVAKDTGEVLASIVVGQIVKYNGLSETNKDS